MATECYSQLGFGFQPKLVVDFAGGALASLPHDANVEPVITLSRGKTELVSARPLASIKGWRAMFDVVPPDARADPIDIRLFLRSDVRTLSETWLYQWSRPAQKAD